MGQVKQIGVPVKNLYTLEVEDVGKYLRSKEKVRDFG